MIDSTVAVAGAYLLLGGLAGLAAGLLGIGGGLIIVPALAFLFEAQGFAPDVGMHQALGTSLATIVLTSVSSVFAHHRRGAVRWAVFQGLGPGILLGAWAGAWLAHWLPGNFLRILFGVFELGVAAQLAFGRPPAPHRRLPATPGLVSAGVGIGSVSAVLGIGGGTLTVPFLIWCNVAIREAVATAAACGLPIALAGTLGFIFAGWGAAGLGPHSIGYVHWPAVLGIALTSTSTAPLGARLAHILSTLTLKRAFAAFLAVVGVRMLIA